MMRKRTEAFTLVELLVAMTLGLAVIASAYAALSSSIDGSRRIDGFVERSGTLSNLSDVMRIQLANAYYSASSDLAPEFTVTPAEQSGVAARAGEAPKDEITFSFAAKTTLSDADPQYPYYTVTYFIADASDDSPGGLSRRVTPLWPRDTAEEPVDELIAPEVRGLAVACYDGTTWTSEWSAATSGLPRAIRLDLYVDDDRFTRDPWQLDSASTAAPHLDIHHVVARVPAAAAAAGGSNAPAQ